MSDTNEQAGEQQRNEERTPTPRLFDRQGRIRKRLAATNADRLFLGLDFDGTLSPYVDDPTEAALAPDPRRALETLSRRESIEIAVISGRALTDVRERVGIAGIEYAGNHGLELEDHSPLPETARHRAAIDAACDRLETRLSRFPGCEIENKAITATVHFRTVEREIEPAIRSIVEEVIDRVDGDLRWTSGSEIVEIRPAFDWDKGHALEWLTERCPGRCFPVYIGDDVTDEDAFRAIASDGIGVHVGNEDTAADYRVEAIEDVATFLRWLDTTGIAALVDDSDTRH